MNKTLQNMRDRIASWPVVESNSSNEAKQERRPIGYENALRSEIPEEQRATIRNACNQERWPLILSGSFGSGKTCAAACLYGQFSHLPMWYRCDDLLLQLATGRMGMITTEYLNDLGELTTAEVTYTKFVQRLGERSALFLDDLGIRKPTEAMYQAFFNILEWRKNKPLIITSNKSFSEIAQLYDDRIADRLAVGTLVKFTGRSRRQKGKS